MRTRITLLVAISLCAFSWPSATYADCPHCFEIVWVRAEFNDGSLRTGYFENHSSVTPIVIDADDAEVIDLSRYSEVMNGRHKIALIDSIYQFDSITTATTPAHIDSVPLSDVKRLVHLGPVGFSAAGSINVYDTSIIRLLHGRYFARFDFERSLADCIYLSYDSAVPQEELASLVSFYDEVRSLDSKLSDDMRYMEKFLRWTEVRYFIGELIPAVCRTDYYADVYDSMSGPSPVGRYYRAISENLRGRSLFLQAVQNYISGMDSSLVRMQFEQVFSSVECRSVEIDFSRPLESNFSEFSELLRTFDQCYQLSRVLGKDYNDTLEDAGVILIENWYD